MSPPQKGGLVTTSAPSVSRDTCVILEVAGSMEPQRAYQRWPLRGTPRWVGVPRRRGDHATWEKPCRSRRTHDVRAPRCALFAGRRAGIRAPSGVPKGHLSPVLGVVGEWTGTVLIGMRNPFPFLGPVLLATSSGRRAGLGGRPARLRGRASSRGCPRCVRACTERTPGRSCACVACTPRTWAAWYGRTASFFMAE